MAKIPPHIEELAKRHAIPPSEFWDCHGTWVCKHRALEDAAARAGVKWATPQVLESDSAKAVSMIATGTLGDLTEWSVGEASPKNNKNAYPWAMAEKRAKDRVILKLLGFAGQVYSEEEADNFKDSAPKAKSLPDASVGALDQGDKSNRDAEAEYNRLRSGLEACLSVEMLDQWVNAWREELDAMPEDYADSLRGEYRRMRDGFQVKEAA